MAGFRFENPKLQGHLRDLYRASGLPHRELEDGSLQCEEAAAATAEALQSAVRSLRFPDWHTSMLPEPGIDEEDDRYLAAVLEHLRNLAIPHEFEVSDGERSVLLPGDEVLPDALWEGVYGPVATLVPDAPHCCFCQQEVKGGGFAEIAVRQAGAAFRSVLYAHAGCLAERVHPEARHILETTD